MNSYVGTTVTGVWRGRAATVRIVSYHTPTGAAARFPHAGRCYFCHLLNKDGEVIAVGYVPAALVEREIVAVNAA